MNHIERIDPPDESCAAGDATADRALETLQQLDPRVKGILVIAIRAVEGAVAFSFHPSGIVPAPDLIAGVMLDGLKAKP